MNNVSALVYIFSVQIMDMIGNPNVPIVLVGNKSDLQNEREVTRDEGEKYAREINAVFLETCAKDNLCVNDLFQVRILT